MTAEKPVIPVVKVFGLPPRKDYQPFKMAIAALIMRSEIEPKYAGADIYLVADMAVPAIIESNLVIEMSFVNQAYVPVLKAIIELVEGYFGPSVRVRGLINFLNGGSLAM